MLTRLSLSSLIGLLIQFLLRLVLYSLLSLSNSINHLGHILTYNLSDDDDICAISEDMCRKAKKMLIAHFLLLWPLCLFSSFCLSMALPFGDLHNPNLEPSKCHLIITFGRFGLLIPRHSHTGIVHSVARLECIYSTVVTRSRNLLASAKGPVLP